MSATWPSDWAERRLGKGCPMCGQGRPEENEHGIRVLGGRFSDAYLQRASWQRGYTVVIWRGRHVAEPTELAEEEAAGYWREVLRVGSALERHYQPVKLNYQILGTPCRTCTPTWCHGSRGTRPPGGRCRSPRARGPTSPRTCSAGTCSPCGHCCERRSGAGSRAGRSLAAVTLPGRRLGILVGATMPGVGGWMGGGVVR